MEIIIELYDVLKSTFNNFEKIITNPKTAIEKIHINRIDERICKK